jgi:hypothetical protein
MCILNFAMMKYLFKAMQIRKIYFLCLLLVLWSCEKDSQDNATSEGNNSSTGFLSFSTDRQTLPTAINPTLMRVKFEVDRNEDVTKLVPRFDVPVGCTVLVNGILQVSGSSKVDFSQKVTYELKDPDNKSAKWEVLAVPIKNKILIDGSHDGGVWWFPQSPATGFDPQKWHQGQPFAELLRKKGFEVDELGRGAELTEEMFFGYYIVIRANGFEKYTSRELEVYRNIISRPMNMVFFTDHKKYDPVDEVGYLLGLNFEGIAYGKITNLKPHLITQNISSIDYNAGSVLTNLAENLDIEVLGWLGEKDYADLNFNGVKDSNEPLAPPVMGILNLPRSHVFFIGDLGGLQVMPQPFIDNLISWMGTGF